MAAIQRNVVLYNDSAAGTGRWYRLDSKYEESGTRSIQIDMNAADTIIIEGTTIERLGGLNPDGSAFDPETDILPIDIVQLNSYNGNAEEADVLNSNWTWVRARKVGATGVAKVQGLL
jgi:hypothetical protein